jgi:Tetratricopeptide repeat
MIKHSEEISLHIIQHQTDYNKNYLKEHLKKTAIMHPFKVIIKGSLEFGNRKSYDSMLAHFVKRLESYYKNDIILILKDETFFNEELMMIEIPRTNLNCGEKTWKNTIGLMRELRSFAVAGELDIWVTEDGKTALLASECVKPQGDKMATTEYLRGVEFLKKGLETKAIESFDKAIEKYDRYAQAFERRGTAHSRLGNTAEALKDFSTSIALNQNSKAYFGVGLVKMKLGDLEGAAIEFQTAIDNAVPYQSIFWMARRVKGECHLMQNEMTQAIFELKLVSKRVFKETDPNFPYRKQAWQTYGESLLKLGSTSEAAAAFREALSIESCAIVEDLLRSADSAISVTKAKVKATPVKATRRAAVAI